MTRIPRTFSARPFLLSGLALVATCSTARADALQDCTQHRNPRLRLEACSAIVTSKSASSADKARAYRSRGEARLDAGAGADAIADFSEAIRLDGADAQSFAGRGQARLTKGNLDGAIADYSEAIRLSPRQAAYYNARGHAHLVKGQPEPALADFSKAAELDSSSASALNNRGLAKSKLGRPDEAISDYTSALQINPTYALAYANRGYAFEAKGQKEWAIADFNRALIIDPTLLGARDGLKRLGAPPEKIADSEKMIGEGKVLVEKTCGWCHATGSAGKSPNEMAPPFHTLASRHPVLALREPLSRGIAAPHDQMPNFQMPDADVDKIIAYINSLTRAKK